MSFPLTGYGGIETDSEGWQKLPLHMEMAMMQQAAKGEDGRFIFKQKLGEQLHGTEGIE